MRRSSALVSSALLACMVSLSWTASVPFSTAAAAEKAAEQPATPKKAKKKKDPGKRLYLRRTCIACHGRNGAKAIQDYPNLAGQDAKYMIAQVKDILSGKRTGSPDATGNPRVQGMRGAIITPEGEHRITPAEIKQVSNWLAKLEPAAPKAPKEPISEDRMKAGAKLYKKAKCQTCHGKEGKKPLKGYPYIAGQKAAYITIQIQDIKAKIRKNGKSKTMFPFVKKLKDDQIALLADYLSQVDRRKAKK
ncbi:c-type cytochrome [Magnetospira sp. QH-2]|uniref:c-type cytochrome n=1 Tax=Magnetospira sp. (strain QH-2) TaxID=1288970 RepID=UPI0003E80A29|nr:c-type cytochrome [Magnetospira sp. QH-2]CCQ73152.1 Putative cytochrome c4 [Magnetospira sp. QH-2]